MSSQPARLRLRSDAEQRAERGESWPELVYDLVFVVAIAELARELEGEIGWREVVRCGLLLIPVWWVWMGVTLATNRFEAGVIAQRVGTFVNMLAAAGLALTVGEATGERTMGFVIAYVVARALAIVLWLRMGWLDPATEPLTHRLAAGSSLALLPWLASLAAPVPQRYWLWAVGLAIDLLTPLSTLAIQQRMPRLNVAHLTERYRMFTVIVLGEAVAGALAGAAATERLPLLSGNLALALAFALGWSVFDGPLAGPTPSGVRGTLTGYLQLPLVAALTALGAGIADVVAHGEIAPSDTTRWLLCAATALSLVTIGALEVIRQSGTVLAALRFGAAAAALLIGLLGSGLDAVALLALLATVVSVQTLLAATAIGPADHVEGGESVS